MSEHVQKDQLPVTAETSYSKEAKEAGHRLYQWVYSQIAEGIDLEGQQVKDRLESENLSTRDMHDAYNTAFSESEFHRTGLKEDLPDEIHEDQTIIHQNVYLAIVDAELLFWEGQD